MLSLVWKDVVVARWFLAAGLPLYAVKLVGFTALPPGYLFVTLTITALLACGSIAIEETQATESLWCSLPVGRREVVLARYTTTLVGVVLGLGLSWAVGKLAFPWLSANPEQPTVIGFDSYAWLLSVLLLGAALFLPCYFRLGAGRGLVAFSWIGLGLLVAVTAAGSSIVALAGGAEALGDPLRGDLVARVGAWLQPWSTAVAAGLTVVALALTAVSAAVSVRFYERRDC